MQSATTAPASSAPKGEPYPWPQDLASLSYDDMKWLARHFAPRLVMFPRLGSGLGEREDYHPIDVRQLFDHVSANLAYESGIPIVRFFAAVGRTWPAALFVLSGIVLIVLAWLLLAMPTLFQRSDDLSEQIWLGVLAVVTASGIVLSVLLAGSLVLRISKWLIVGMSLGLVLGVWFLATATGLWPDIDLIRDLIGDDLAQVLLIPGVLLNGFLGEAFRVRGKADAKRLLTSLDAKNGPKLDGSMQFIDAGSVHDRDKHKQAYLTLIKAAKPEYRETAYVHISPGQYRFTGLLAIQYWFLYYYNYWENVHESDWEQVTVYVNPNAAGLSGEDSTTKFAQARPLACAFSAHDGGHLALWTQEDMEWLVDDEGGQHPVVYVAWGSHANYPKAGQYPATTNFAGLTIGGREAGIFKGQTLFGYVDVTYGAGPANVNNEGEPIKWEDGKEIALVVIPPGLPQDGGRLAWPHICGTRLSPDPCNASVGVTCSNDFNWLNLRGGWGAAGSLFGGDGAPDTPCNQGSWHAFEWLSRCRQVHVGDGHEIFAGYLDRLRREAAIKEHVASRPAKQAQAASTVNKEEKPDA